MAAVVCAGTPFTTRLGCRMSPWQIGEVSLESPDERFETSYGGLVEEFKSRGERLVPFTLAFEYAKFEDLVKKLQDNSVGIGLPVGFVPHSSYWLVRGQE